MKKPDPFNTPHDVLRYFGFELSYQEVEGFVGFAKDAYEKGVKKADNKARRDFLKEYEHDMGLTQKAVGILLGYEKNNTFTNDLKRLSFAPDKREAIDLRGGRKINFPDDDEKWASGLFSAMEEVHERLNEKADARHELTGSRVLAVIDVSIELDLDAQGQAIVAAYDKIRNSVEAAIEQNKSDTMKMKLMKELRMANGYDLAAISLEWVVPYLFCLACIPPE